MVKHSLYFAVLFLLCFISVSQLKIQTHIWLFSCVLRSRDRSIFAVRMDSIAPVKNFSVKLGRFFHG